MRFSGSDQYVATRDPTLAVNAAITLERPLPIKGEPGSSKSMLAEEIAAALRFPRFQWHVKSTTKTQQRLYEYDAVSRQRPIVCITSNNEKELPDTFLHRSFFHYIKFPDKETMTIFMSRYNH